MRRSEQHIPSNFCNSLIAKEIRHVAKTHHAFVQKALNGAKTQRGGRFATLPRWRSEGPMEARGHVCMGAWEHGAWEHGSMGAWVRCRSACGGWQPGERGGTGFQPVIHLITARMVVPRNSQRPPTLPRRGRKCEFRMPKYETRERRPPAREGVRISNTEMRNTGSNPTAVGRGVLRSSAVPFPIDPQPPAPLAAHVLPRPAPPRSHASRSHAPMLPRRALVTAERELL